MITESISLMLAVVGTACWIACFVWMHQISRKQQALLDEIRTQAKRIEALSRAEHDLIKEVHPEVLDIGENVKEVMAVVKETPKEKS